MDRQEVIDEFEKYGISKVEATARINSLTDEEIAALVKDIDSVPAGGNFVAVLVYAVLLAVLLVLYLPGLLIKTIECIFSDCEAKGGLAYVFRPIWKDESISPEVCHDNCNSDYNECLKTDSGWPFISPDGEKKSQCEIEKQMCDKRCNVAFDKDFRKDTREEYCDPGMESCD